MRLIDAENFSKAMKDYFTDMITHHKYNVDCVDCNADLQHLLDEQLTAYDIGKVVEELEENASRYTKKYITPYGNNGYRDTKAISVNKATEIVKQGIVSDDVCEWKFEETNGIAWHCDDKCTTYNQVYIKDLKITLEDFECKCPYCGKKIKVVE